jgi:lysophospholipase L1-like esterase
MRIAFFGDSLTSGVPGSSYFAILEDKLPDHTLFNFGKGNDTVVSLHRRIAKLQFDEPFDLAFLWIGVNDVTRQASWLSQSFNTLLGQRGAADLDEFRQIYQSTLDFLDDHAQRIIAVSPSIKGEDLHNRWNHHLSILSSAIADMADELEQVQFLDLGPTFAQELVDRPISDYVPRNPGRVILDGLLLWSDEQIDQRATARGLHLTLDGLHLNSVGAQLVAETFLTAIEELMCSSPVKRV